MPELPDVEMLRRYLISTSLYQRIETVQVQTNKILGNVSAVKLRAALRGHEFRRTMRHGKHLFAQLDSAGWLALHFGMTGYLKYFKQIDKKPAYDRLLIGFVNGFHLGYYSERLLGSIELVDNPSRLIEARRLGADALDSGFDLTAFKRAMAARKGIVKSTLMNQRIIAGIGNIYADEILFQSRIRPKANVADLDEETLRALFKKMKTVLRKTVACGANPARFPRTYLTPQRYKGGRCPRCGDKLARIRISARSAYFCRRCQDKP